MILPPQRTQRALSSRLDKKFSAFIKDNLTVISKERDGITHLLHPPRL